jgi:hypothetical protein
MSLALIPGSKAWTLSTGKDDQKFADYGPAATKLLIDIYPDYMTEFANFKTGTAFDVMDWPLMPTDLNTLRSLDPSNLTFMEAYFSEFGLFEYDLNDQVMPTNIPAFRVALSWLINKDFFINYYSGLAGSATKANSPIASCTGYYNPSCPSYEMGATRTTLGDSSSSGTGPDDFQDMLNVYVSLVDALGLPVPDTGSIPSRVYGNYWWTWASPYPTPSVNYGFPALANGHLLVFARASSPARALQGTYLEELLERALPDWINTNKVYLQGLPSPYTLPSGCNGAHVYVDDYIVSRTIAFCEVMSGAGPNQYRYNVYTGYWQLSRDPDFLQYYTSQYSSTVVSMMAHNYGGFMDAAYDRMITGYPGEPNTGLLVTTAADGDPYFNKLNTYGHTVGNATYWAYQAQLEMMKPSECALIPMWYTTGYMACLSSDTHVVNEIGAGLNNWYTLLNAYNPLAGTPGYWEPTGQFSYGFQSDWSTGNPITASWVWDWDVLNEIYDPLIRVNPYNMSNDSPYIADSWTYGTWNAGSTPNNELSEGNCTTITFQLRDDVFWQDVPYTVRNPITWNDSSQINGPFQGVPFTLVDVAFSIMYLRDLDLYDTTENGILVDGVVDHVIMNPKWEPLWNTCLNPATGIPVWFNTTAIDNIYGATFPDGSPLTWTRTDSSGGNVQFSTSVDPESIEVCFTGAMPWLGLDRVGAELPMLPFHIWSQIAQDSWSYNGVTLPGAGWFDPEPSAYNVLYGTGPYVLLSHVPTVGFTLAANVAGLSYGGMTLRKSYFARFSLCPLAHFVASPSPFYMGEEISFNASESEGTWNGTVWSPIVEYTWNWGDGSPLENDTNPQAFHSFAYAGSYQVSLRVKDASGSVSDWFGQVISVVNEYPPPPDVAVTGVTLSSNFAYVGENVSISADVRNLGYSSETANVTAYANNSTVIGNEITIGAQLQSFPAASFAALNFVWNTMGVPAGSYIISVFAHNLTQDADLTNNLYVGGNITVYTPIPISGINVTCPSHLELNPPIFNFNYTLTALQASLGNVTINSTGYEGQVPILGSINDSIHLCVGQPDQEFGKYYLPLNGSITTPLWLLFETGPGAHDWTHYQGLYEMQLSIGGVYILNINVNIISLDVCHNGAVCNAGGTATFNQTVTGGSWVYLEAEPHLPPGWSFTVNPLLGTLFETPHQMTVNITAAPDAEEGDIGYVTLRAYHNGTGLLIWQYTFFSSVSTQPPTIEAIQPPVSTLSGDILFNATVKDKSGIQNVTLCYSVDNGLWNNQTMQLKSGDMFNSSTLVSTIPHMPDGTTLRYYITATDWLGRQTQSQVQTITVKTDLAAVAVKSQKAIVSQGSLVPINLTIANYGTLPATALKVYVYANATCIHTENVPLIENGTALSITFYWNTTGIPRGNYLLSGFVSPIVGEADTSNNSVAGDTVEITIPPSPVGGSVGITGYKLVFRETMNNTQASSAAIDYYWSFSIDKWNGAQWVASGISGSTTLVTGYSVPALTSEDLPYNVYPLNSSGPNAVAWGDWLKISFTFHWTYSGTTYSTGYVAKLSVHPGDIAGAAMVFPYLGANGKVEIFDLMTVAFHWNMKVAWTGNINPLDAVHIADIDMSGTVGILDLMAVAFHWNQQWTNTPPPG